MENRLWDLSDVRDWTHDSPKYQNTWYPLITSKNLLSNWSMDFNNVSLISEEDYVSINKRSWVSKWDILFWMIWTIWNPVIVKEEWFAIKNVALIKELRDLRNVFLIQWLSWSQLLKQFYQLNAWWTQKFIALGVIRWLKINLPKDKNEQQKIAWFLTTVDTKIQQLESLKLAREQYKTWVMQKIFSQEIRFKNENGEVFGEWEEKRLGEIWKFSKWKWISKSDIVDNWKNECLRYGELYTTYAEQVGNIVSYTNIEKEFSILSEQNDVVIPSSWETQLDIARACYVWKEWIILWWDLNVFRSNEDWLFLSYYLNYYLKKKMARLAQWNSVVHLYSSQLVWLRIKLPSLDEQRLISNHLSKFDNYILQIDQEIELAKLRKKWLLQQMFV